MITCSKCSSSFSEERHKLGYTICTECSNEERKVGHVVYPHKTGAYVQAVSSETAKRLNQLDRRGYRRQSGYSMPKSISSKKISHDNLNPRPSVVRANHLSNIDATSKVKKYYKEWGFSRTMEYIRQLNIKGRIPLKLRSELEGSICDMYVN
tara:strand:- start:738 stop:1193 length:456 start_codon:yes stop_codon:yes gene_type:complete